MPAVRSLHLAPRIPPLAAGPEAGAVLALCRALDRAGEEVVVVSPRSPVAPGATGPAGASGAAGEPSDEDLDRAGLARRLDPFVVAGPHGPASFTVREGRLAGGAATLLALEGPATADPELLARAALELAASRGLWPDLVRAWDEAPELVYLAGERPPPPGRAAPGTVLLVRDPTAPVRRPLRAALDVADRIALPSVSFAGELIQRGEGEVVELLRAAPERVRGIPAGVDQPPPDPAPRAGRPERLRRLRRELGLPPSRAPLACVLGPLDLLDRDIGEALVLAGAQLVFLHPRGAAPGAAQLALDLAHDHPLAVRALDADRALEDQVIAAADLALFCHRFAPGPFSPLGCMLRGTVPIAPRSGAFADAVIDWDPTTGTGTGFLYPAHRPEEIPGALRRAVRAAASGGPWQDLVTRVAATDLSWRTAGLRHAELGRDALRVHREVALADLP